MSGDYVPLGDPETGLASHYAFAEGEEILAADLEGNVVGALAEDGETWLEVEDGYAVSDPDYPGFAGEEYDDGEEYVDPQLAEYDERLGRVEEHLERQDFDPIEDMGEQATMLEAIEDRRLTLRERRDLANEGLFDDQNGERPDLGVAANRLEAMGQPLHDLDGGSRGQRHQARTEYVAELLSDRERRSAADRGEDDLAFEQAPPAQAWFDAEDRGERHAFLQARMNGHDVGTYDGSELSDYPEEE